MSVVAGILDTPPPPPPAAPPAPSHQDDFFNGNAQNSMENGQAGASQKPKKGALQKIRETDTKTVVTYLRYANLCNAICIITAGSVTVATLGSGSIDLTTMFIGLYIA